MKFLFYTDIHMFAGFNDFAKADDNTYTDRFGTQLKIMKTIYDKAQEIGAVVINAGDLFHERTKVDVRTFNATFELLAKYPEVQKIFLRGNHDSVNEQMGSTASIDTLQTLPKTTVISTPTATKWDGVKIYFEPYSNDLEAMRVNFKELSQDALEARKSGLKTILVGHFGVDGAYGVGDRKLTGGFNVTDLYPEAYDLTYLGHYHKRQQLSDDKDHEVMYGGSTLENSFGDSGSPKGYDLVTIEEGTLTREFFESDAPKFLTITNPKEAEKALEQGNYVKLSGTIEEQQELSELPEDLKAHLRFIKEDVEVQEAKVDSKRLANPQMAVEAYVKQANPELLQASLECINEAVKQL